MNAFHSKQRDLLESRLIDLELCLSAGGNLRPDVDGAEGDEGFRELAARATELLIRTTLLTTQLDSDPDEALLVAVTEALETLDERTSQLIGELRLSAEQGSDCSRRAVEYLRDQPTQLEPFEQLRKRLARLRGRELETGLENQLACLLERMTGEDPPYDSRLEACAHCGSAASPDPGAHGPECPWAQSRNRLDRLYFQGI